MFKKVLVIGMICLSVGSVGFARPRTFDPGYVAPVSSSK